MLRVKEEKMYRPSSRAGRRLTIALFVALTLAVSAWRGPVAETQARPGASVASPGAEVVPFDLSLVGPGEDKEVDGVYAVRPAAILKRPCMKPVLQLLNAQIDLLAAPLMVSGLDVHVEDVEQLMGRVYFGGENKTGKRSLMMSVNVLRTTRDMEWVKLREKCGMIMKQHQWKGETYVSVALPAFLAGITGIKDDGYLWAADSRTLIFDSEDAIKAQIDARAARTRLGTPDYAAGWDRLSRGWFAVALNNRGRRLLDRTVTEEEIKEALADPAKPECHLVRFYQNVSGVVAGCAGEDDFRFDLRGTAETPAAAAALARCCVELLAAAKKTTSQEKVEDKSSDPAEAAAFGFLREVLDRTTVRRDGGVVTVHADVASGLNKLLALYAKGQMAAK
jgi:hypothetical protein